MNEAEIKAELIVLMLESFAWGIAKGSKVCEVVL